MANATLDSQLDPILQRRKQLRNQRRLKFLQASWRTFAVSGLAGGLIWVAHLPEWVIQRPSQVSIKGNQLLSTQAIQSLLPLSYPQNLIRLQPEAIAKVLESKAPIDKVTVTRRLFPPSLAVAVQERYPVAVIPCLDHHCVTPGTASLLSNRTDVWLLDSRGVIMPLKNYPSLQDSAKLPKLTVLGMVQVSTRNLEASNPVSQQGSATQVSTLQSERTSIVVDKQNQSQWPSLYQAIRHSPVKIFEIDWRDAANLILKTELGTVHLGPYSSKFADQLHALDQMRKLSRYLSSNRVGYINLENPEHPLLQLKNTPESSLTEKLVESPH
jgi:cell division protein FtsQ